MRRGKVHCSIWTVCNHQSHNVWQNKSQIKPQGKTMLMFRNPATHSRTHWKNGKEATPNVQFAFKDITSQIIILA